MCTLLLADCALAMVADAVLHEVRHKVDDDESDGGGHDELQDGDVAVSHLFKTGTCFFNFHYVSNARRFSLVKRHAGGWCVW